MKDLRRHPRKDCGAALILAGREQDLVDLSSNGMCVQTEAHMPIGGEVPFALAIPGGRRIHGLAKVRWAQGSGWRRAHGLEIVKLGRFQERHLHRYLNPRRFGFGEALDIALEFACAVLVVLLAQSLLQSQPALAQAAVDAAPWAFMAGGLGLSAYLLSAA